MAVTSPEAVRTAQPAQLIDEVAGTREALREQARQNLGVGGEETKEGFFELRRRYGLALYPLFALSLLSIVDTFQGYAFQVLAPDISRALGIGLGAISAAIALKTLAVSVAPLPIAWLSQQAGRRAMLCIVTGIAWSLMTLFTGFVTALIGLIAVLVVDGLTTGSVTALHYPLVMDTYHPRTRVRALSAYTSAGFVGNVGAPLLVALFAGILGLTWRGVFVAMGLMSIGFTLLCVGLRDPGFGKWDTERVRAQVHQAAGDPAEALSNEDVELGFWEICQRLLMIPTLRRTYVGLAVFGLLQVPLATFISFFLEQQWNLDAAQRGLFFAYFAAASVVGLALYGRRGEREFQRNPVRVPRTVGLLLAAAVLLIAAGGLAPTFGLMVAFFGAGALGLGPLTVGLGISMLSVIPARMRPHAQALGGIFVAVGGLLGSIYFAGVNTRYGIAGSMVAVAIPGVLGALVIGSAGRHINRDLDRMIDETLEEEQIRRIQAGGGHLPMLACRKLNFAYGQLQVLFDVDFTVDDGEMVALLGVNGAGKSTLLKAVSGIGLPTGGSIRFRGQEITYLDAERRLRLGITQIPGGRAVFGPMTVTENLRAFGYSLGRDRRSLEAAIDRCLTAFPRLAERRNSLAATLSGGEQQMLGLSKALILRPRLLLIDELSLGLAPVIVAQLLDMVRQINADGTAVVLVEQSVNIALNLVEHAYFMEKGEMRFDGKAADLLARGDLLRAVFLQGAGAAG
jgi:ABC-type branched-subunit amino acid transport system ATPase component/predicted MFS family arabinose efflux permease